MNGTNIAQTSPIPGMNKSDIFLLGYNHTYKPNGQQQSNSAHQFTALFLKLCSAERWVPAKESYGLCNKIMTDYLILQHLCYHDNVVNFIHCFFTLLNHNTLVTGNENNQSLSRHHHVYSQCNNVC